MTRRSLARALSERRACRANRAALEVARGIGDPRALAALREPAARALAYYVRALEARALHDRISDPPARTEPEPAGPCAAPLPHRAPL